MLGCKMGSHQTHVSEGKKSFSPQELHVRETTAGAVLLLKALGVQNLSGGGSGHKGCLWLR